MRDKLIDKLYDLADVADDSLKYEDLKRYSNDELLEEYVRLRVLTHQMENERDAED